VANIKDRIAVKQIAFEFDGSTRVFKCDQFEYVASDEMQSWQTIDNQYRTETRAIFLDFNIRSDWFKEQASGTACDRIDIMDALKGTGNVYFYPIYDVDNSVKYWVQKAQRETSLLETRETVYRKSWAYKMRTASGLDNYPTWSKFK